MGTKSKLHRLIALGFFFGGGGLFVWFFFGFILFQFKQIKHVQWIRHKYFIGKKYY
jgi:hypothetical protein